MKIIVTGGSGLISSHEVDQLIEDSFEVVVTISNHSSLSKLNNRKVSN